MAVSDGSRVAAPDKEVPIKTQDPTAGARARVLCGLGIALAFTLSPGAAWAQIRQVPDPQAAQLDIIRGVIKPSAEAVLSSQIEGRISRLPFKDGQRFKKGSTLVRLDCDKYEAELAASYAEHEARKKSLQNTLRLARLQAIGKVEVDIAKAEAQKAWAGVRVAKVNVRGCRVKAPFAGRVVQVMVNEHENVFPNDLLVSILDDSRLEIELILPSKSLSWVVKDTTFEFEVDETGRIYEAKVEEIGASVDPVSQTIRYRPRVSSIRSRPLNRAS